MSLIVWSRVYRHFVPNSFSYVLHFTVTLRVVRCWRVTRHDAAEPCHISAGAGPLVIAPDGKPYVMCT